MIVGAFAVCRRIYSRPLRTDSLNSTPIKPRKIAVIGGGISALAAAHRLIELDQTLDVALFEASERVGGVLQTERREGFLFERSADMFTTNEPWAIGLCQRIGFDKQLIGTNAAGRKAFIVHRGRLISVPSGFSMMSPTRVWPILTTPLLSVGGKLRLAWEYFTPVKKDDADESLASFARRRLGKQVYERLVQPLIGGIYSADPERLSMQATLRRFVDMEREHGGLIRGMRRSARASDTDRKARGARYDMFVTPRDGMSSLVAAIADQLPSGSVRVNSRVERLMQRGDGKWDIVIDQSVERFDAVIVALPAPRAADLIKGLDKQLADDLAGIPYTGTSVVISAYRRNQIKHPLDGFGLVAPQIEQRQIIACSFASVKFAGRAPDDSVLLRTFVGGACQPEMMQLDDKEIEALVGRELRELIGATGEPLFCEVARWGGAMPQYHVGHLDLVERMEQRAESLPHFALAGNAYRGVGIPFCVRSGEAAAERILEHRAARSA